MKNEYFENLDEAAREDRRETPEKPNPKARYGNKNALKPPEERRVRMQFSLHRDTLSALAEIRAATGETASAVVARAIKEAHKLIKY